LHRAFGPRIAVPVAEVRARAEPSPPHRLNGKGRRRRRQCGDGVLLRTAPEERPGPEAVADPRRAPDRDRHLDRTQVSPPPSTGPSGSIDPHRIRDHHEPGREPRGLTPQLSPNGAAVPDRDNHQGVAEETAPGMEVAVTMAQTEEEYSGYDLEVKIPFDILPDSIDPAHMGFNVLINDSDTQNQT